VGEAEDTSAERPAEFVPVIVTSSGSEYEATKGQTFVIREAAASLGEETLDVEVKAYYIRGGEKTEVALDGNKLVLDNAGEYHVIYRAESTRYTTSFGNPTYAEKDVKIISCIGGGDSLAKLYDTNGALPEGTDAAGFQNRIGQHRLQGGCRKNGDDRRQISGVRRGTCDGGRKRSESERKRNDRH